MTGVQTCALPICFPVTILSNIKSEITQIVLQDKSMFITAKDGLVEVIKLKPEGKSSMSGEEFLRGRANLVGKKLN